MRRSPFSCRGFSLLELIVVVSIVGVISTVVVASLSAGIRVWESARALTALEQELYFGVELFRRDTVNTFAFHAIKFSGEEHTVSMPSVLSSYDEDGEGVQRVGTVKYVFDEAGQSLVRMAWPFPEKEDTAVSEVIAEDIQSVNFRYLDGSDEDAGSGWVGLWDHPTNFPAAVSIELQMTSGGQVFAVERQFPLVEGLWLDE